MLVSYDWVKEFFPTLDLDAENLAEAITRTGIEIEGVEHLDASLKKIVVGEVLTCEKHPSADKLNKTTVQTDEEEPIQIICGAPNVRAGQKVIVAKVGARLPGGFKIKRAKLRGEVSEGMICSLQELGFEGKVVPKAYQDGIFVLPEEATVGADAIRLLGLYDAILDMAITPNRADALSMIGVAHEVGAITGQTFAPVEQPDVPESGSIEGRVAVKVEATEAAPYYAVKLIEGITIQESPLWLQTRLMKAGIRPHNNVVDVTNYINLLYGQPLHSFDYEKISSKEIVVRLAKEGETLTTLDDQKRDLPSGAALITDGTEPIAIAGVMGGASTEVTDATTAVLLEGAIFSAGSIGKTSRELGLRTEASIRYDKGSDAFKVEKALAHGAALIAELSGGTLISGVVEADNRETGSQVISTELGRINRLLGTNLEVADIEQIFARLGFELQVEGEVFTVTVPSRRWDITIEADLLEEIARIYGYDNIPATLPATASTGGLTPSQTARRLTRRYLEGAGLTQALTYSLVSEKEAGHLALKEAGAVKLAMPMSEEHSHLRQSIVPGLLHSARYNVARKNQNVHLYELGSVFYATTGDALPEEEEHLAGLITGEWAETDWQKATKPVDFFILKGIVEGLVQKLGITSPVTFKPAQKADLHPGRTAALYLDEKEIGYLGALHPATEKAYDLHETYVFELNFAALLEAEKTAILYQAIPRYPAVTRDIAFVVGEDVAHQAILTVIRENGGKLLQDVKLFDIFQGDSLGENKKSMAYSLTYQDPERTLVEEEVSAQTEQVTNALQEAFGAVIR
ncbi:phenylalanine--tRNA ligase subunit beta [Listeria costaricensis]|uniref:phenylalanine--tRNA ligase subunit beta n=1 Tax=Listeria costaricensis TaxID=2026604 RepID=UPI000C069BDF|nr:phenylalanine--tRNA ligase subunit beta [Listeria costaricensis]